MDPDLINPPKSAAGGLPWVDIRVNLFKVNAVSTVDATSYVDLWLVMYWNDSRMINHTGLLPDKLWGPRFNLRNKLKVRIDVAAPWIDCNPPSMARRTHGWLRAGSVLTFSVPGYHAGSR